MRDWLLLSTELLLIVSVESEDLWMLLHAAVQRRKSRDAIHVLTFCLHSPIMLFAVSLIVLSNVESTR